MGGDVVQTIADLILVRLLAVNEKGITEREIRGDLAGFLAVQYSSAEQKRLIGDGLAYLNGRRWVLKARPDGKRSYRYQATRSGTLEARLFLGSDYYPKRLPWRTLKEKYLPARALGLKIMSAREFQYINIDGLRAECLRQAYPVPLKPFVSLTRVVAHQAAALKKARNIAPHGLRQALVESLIHGAAPGSDDGTATEAPETDQAMELSRFAVDVKTAAGQASAGRYGDRKVFISHVWQAYYQTAPDNRLDLPGFKKHLVDAHLSGFLVLSEADLPDQLDHHDLTMSATPYLNMTFHFVRLD